MSKLAWVLLPLLLAALAVGWLALRRQLPSRLALNVGSSLLLLVYLGTTAGLGIFWVANQHLPVFDWHYLFGYATVLLLLVHLGFNFRIVWRWWAQRSQRHKAPAPVAAAEPRPPRDARGPVLGVLGALLLALGAYGLGLRHGRTELRVLAGDPSGGPPGPDAGPAAKGDARLSLAVVEQFHEFSAHSRQGLFRRAPGVDWGDPPPSFKSWLGTPVVGLPPPWRDDARPTSGAAPGAPSLPQLSTLLFACAGVNLERGSIAFRTSPSSGALFATELFVRVHQLPGLAPGLYAYHGGEHRLHRLRALPPQVGAAAVELLATAVFRRSGHKYRDRAYRYILADLGHLLENLRAAALALGVEARPLRAFDEAEAARLLGVDEAEEGVLSRWELGPTAAPPPAVAWSPAALAAQAALGVTDAIHRATSLRAVSVGGVSAQAAEPPPLTWATRPADPAWQALPPAVASPMPVLQRIARRRSARRYADTPLSLAELSGLLEAMTRAAAPLFSPAVRIDVLSAAVQGLAPAAWRYEPSAHALRHKQDLADLRRRARSAALGQDVIGDAAAVFVLSIDRAAFRADALGAARGYRHAFIEAGLVGERLYLEATARGLSVCGVGAFYDDEAAALVAVDPAAEWVLHFAAVGRPG
jgi:SagB-type dehydrogenase family enzyme